MKFGQPPTTRSAVTVRNFASRREQWRLLVIVFAIGLAVYLTASIGNPKRWEWLAKLGRGEIAREGAEIDTRLHPPEETVQTPLGTFLSPAAPVESEKPAAVSAQEPGGITPALLATVRDDTYFTSSEKAAWFQLFAVLQRAKESELARAAQPASFAQLFNQSAQYRGTLVSTAGTVRRAHRLTAPSNDKGIASYFQVWLQPDDNPSSPMVLYVLELPDRFPLGMDLDEPVSVVGFYYKRWAYNAQDTIRTAPTLLAKTVHWNPRPPAKPPVTPAQLPAIIGIAAALTAFFLVWLYFRTRRVPAVVEAAPDLQSLAALDRSEDAAVPPERGGTSPDPPSG